MAPTTTLSFVSSHVVQLTVLEILVGYSWAKKKLTTGGIVAAVVTALIHIAHPLALPFNLLVGFFIVGTLGTKVKFCTEDEFGTHRLTMVR